MDTGLRASELCDLTIGDYDQSRSRLLIRHGKGDKPLIVPLGTTAKRLLWRYLADRPDAKPDEPLFATKSGKQLDRNNLGNLLESLGKAAAVSDVHNSHRLGHTFAINFLRNGGHLFLLKELLGHVSLDQTKRYARIAEVDIDNAAKHSVADHWR